MNYFILHFIFGLMSFGISSAFADETSHSTTTQFSEAKPQVKYQAAKDVNFEEMLIQGQIRRPEISVVTGNTQQGADGLLRLRENFTDRIQMDAGEEL
jgi:hypothetical protein